MHKGGTFLEIYNLFPGSWHSNCYVLIGSDEDQRRKAIVIDPSADARDIVEFLKEKNARLEYIVLTHGHFDHIMTLDKLRDIANVPAYIHKDDGEMLADGEKNAYSIFFGEDKAYRPAEKTLQNGDVLTLGCDKLEIIAVPGHSKGSICLLNQKDGFLITGDTLFASGYGRYDLYGGNIQMLTHSLLYLRDLDENLVIYPGHGDCEKLGKALDNLYAF